MVILIDKLCPINFVMPLPWRSLNQYTFELTGKSHTIEFSFNCACTVCAIFNSSNLFELKIQFTEAWLATRSLYDFGPSIYNLFPNKLV